MLFINIGLALCVILALSICTSASLKGSDLEFYPRNSNAPRALLINEKGEPVESLATNAFTMCLFAKLDKHEGLTDVDLLSFSSQEHDEVNEIVIMIDYDDDETNLYLHGTNVVFEGVPPLEEWAHLCMSWESEHGKATLYINGQRVGKVVTVEPGYKLGGKGYFILAQDQDSYNGGFDPESGVHGKLTEFNFWNRTLTVEEVRQAQSCSLEGNVVNWSEAEWSLLGLAHAQETENPCRRETPKELGCGCDNSKIEEFHNLFLTYKTELENQLNETKQQMSSVSQVDETASQNIAALTERINANENDITTLRQISSSCQEEMISAKQRSDTCQREISALQQQSMELERQIFQANLRSDEWESRLEELERHHQFEMQVLMTELERDREAVRASNRCPNKFINLGGRCYYFSTTTKQDRNEAMKVCRTMSGSSLVDIETSEEWTNIKHYIDDRKSLTSKNWWTGGLDLQKKGNWIWPGTSQPLTFTAWCPGEPNNHDKKEDCLNIWMRLGQICWNDLPCKAPNSIPMNFICEM